MMKLPIRTTILGSACDAFNMPLFFFVSGLFAYKPIREMAISIIWSSINGKAKSMVIGCFVFYCIFQFCHQESIMAWFNKGFAWYWFTIVLFQMFVVVYVLIIVCRMFKSETSFTIGLIALASLLFIINVRGVNIQFQIWKMLNWYDLTYYFQFFAFGIICRKYQNGFERLLKYDWFVTLIIITFIASLMALYGYDKKLMEVNSSIYRIIEMIMFRYSALISIYFLFYFGREFFEGNSAFAKVLKFTGTRTLDIYYIHVFFLPIMPALGCYLTLGENMGIIQFVVSLSITLVIISMCLIVSYYFRRSSFLSEWLFGAKIKKSYEKILHA